MSQVPPQAVVIAGPNGSGKSTCARLLLPAQTTFINADMIAQEMTGVEGTAADFGAGRLLLKRIDVLEAHHDDFAIETTLATKKLAPRLQRLKEKGYETHLVFFWLPSADLAVQRVAERVRAGGHDVPEDTVRRRYASGLRHFFDTYQSIVDTWRVYDNARIADPSLIASGSNDGTVDVARPEVWRSVRALADELEAAARAEVAHKFRTGTPVDVEVREAVRQAVEEHRRLKNPIAAWRDDEVVIVPPDEIPPKE